VPQEGTGDYRPSSSSTSTRTPRLLSGCRRCADSSHLNVDECGAPESIAGVKLLTVTTEHGKLTPELVEARIERLGNEHAVQPGVVSISQCTELGTAYTQDEVARSPSRRTGTGWSCTWTERV
jgi:hypothetical protein